MKCRSLFQVAVAVFAFATGSTRAAYLLQPSGATTPIPTYAGDIGNIINQSGLSQTYTSMVTDFDAYMATVPVHDSFSNDNYIWEAETASAFSNHVDITVGGTQSLDAFVFWNGAGNLGVRDFTLSADDNPDFTSPTLLGSYTASLADVGNAAIPQIFSFAAVDAAYIRMTFTSNQGNPVFMHVGEVAFRSVPEPSAPGLALVAGLGAALSGRRRRCA